MLNTEEQCVVCELESMLDIAEDANTELVAENNDLKDILIATLLQLGEFKDDYIEALEDELEFLDPLEEDDDNLCGCGCCH